MKKIHTATILNTKLQRPFLPNDFISRDNLLIYLNENINRSLTLVSAGAGFGKSTLISSWLDSIIFRNCWFSIDEQDNDIRNFLSYFIASIQTIIPNFGQNIYRNIFSPNINSIDNLTNNLINDLYVLNKYTLLVLDDFQHIKNKDITNLISNILKHHIKNFHLVIISRTEPPLPLHKLNADNKIKHINSSHLKLNNHEIKEFLQNNFNYDEQIISLFNNKFEGWITGIRLLKIHLSYTNYDKNKLKNIIQDSKISKTYFIEELIKQLDNKTLKFLLQTSVFQKFNAELTDYVLSQEGDILNSKNEINQILNKNLFLINLDNTNVWFRYHHLFQETLQNEFEKKYNKKETTELHKKAVEWYIKNKLFEEAFYHITQINNVEIIADFIRNNMYMPLNINKWFVLEKWLKHIPDNIINKCPVLLTAEMWVMQHKGVYWIIPELINNVEKIKNNNIELYNSIKHQLVFFNAVINFWSGNIEKSIEQFSFVRKKIASDNLGAIGLSSIYYAVASQMLGNGDSVYKDIQVEINRNNLPVDYKIILLASLVYMRLLNGDLYTAERITKRIARLSTETNNNFYIVWQEFFMGYINFQQNKTKKALSNYKKVLDLVYLLNTHAPIDAFAGTLITLKLLGNNNKTKDINNELTSFIYEWSNPAYNTIAQSLKTHLLILNDEIEKASEEFKKIEMSFDTKTVIFNIEVPRITHCKLLLKTNKKQDEVINKLNDIYNYVTKYNNTPQTIDILILLSVAYYKKNNTLKAIDYLEKAIILAEKGHFIYPFIEQTDTVRILLPKIKSDDENISNFILLLIKSIPNKNNNPSIKLSKREIDIINQLSNQLSNQEIANNLFISNSTVKRHTINIYHKLKVNNRYDAVEKYKKMKVIK